jgi:hypothetical protein
MTLTNSVTDPIAASLACLRGRLPPGSRVIVFGSQARGEASRTQLSSTPRTDQEPARQVDATRRGCAGYSFCRLRNSPFGLGQSSPAPGIPHTSSATAKRCHRPRTGSNPRLSCGSGSRSGSWRGEGCPSTASSAGPGGFPRAHPERANPATPNTTPTSPEREASSA